jgi:hypothetical protein
MSLKGKTLYKKEATPSASPALSHEPNVARKSKKEGLNGKRFRW